PSPDRARVTPGLPLRGDHRPDQFYPGELQCGILLGGSAVSPSPTAWAALGVSLGYRSALSHPLWGGHHGAPGDRAGGRLALSVVAGVSRCLARRAGEPP